MTLTGKVAVVTGGSRGVGKGIASEVARHGATVFVTGRTEADLARVEGATGIRCDHRDEAQVDAAFQRIVRERGGIDILVNNVWGGYERMVDNGEFTWGKPFWEQPLWRWDAMFSAGVRAALPREPAGGAGHDCPRPRTDREHFVLVGAEARGERRLRRREGRDRQDDRGHGGRARAPRCRGRVALSRASCAPKK